MHMNNAFAEKGLKALNSYSWIKSNLSPDKMSAMTSVAASLCWFRALNLIQRDAEKLHIFDKANEKKEGPELFLFKAKKFISMFSN